MAQFDSLPEIQMPIRISRKDAIVSFAVLRQAQLSIHRGSGWWNELQDFYGFERLQWLDKCISKLATQCALAPSFTSYQPSPGNTSFGWLKSAALRISGRLNPGRRLITLPEVEVFNLLALLQDWRDRIYQLPVREQLMELRLEMAYLECALELRCSGIAEMAMAVNVEHFGQADFRPHCTIEKIADAVS